MLVGDMIVIWWWSEWRSVNVNQRIEENIGDIDENKRWGWWEKREKLEDGKECRVEIQKPL